MKVACLQMDMLLAKPEENFSHAAELVKQAMEAQPDVLVLPETWNTGFFPKKICRLCATGTALRSSRYSVLWLLSIR